jgi:CubicO group peptidase (beta-lactamase class C family)
MRAFAISAMLCFFLTSVCDARAIDTAFGDFAKPGMPGCNVAVVRQGEIIERGSFGLADIANGVPLSAESRFDIGSMSKQFTAFLVLDLAARGQIDLNADVHRYLPELPRYRWPVTIAELLHHASGIMDYGVLLRLAGWVYGDEITERDAMWIVKRVPLLNFRPNTQEQYSDSNYLLLAAVVERVTGRPFSASLQEKIFGPLGMTETSPPADQRTVIPHEARPYVVTEGQPYVLQNAIETYGDGQIVTTVDDFAKWEGDFDSGILGENVLSKMTETSRFADRDVNNYAAGLEIKSYRGVQMIEHDGANGGFVSDAIRFPSMKLSVIVLCNRRDGSILRRILRVADSYLDAQLGTPSPTPSLTPSASNQSYPPNLLIFAGGYLRADGSDSHLFSIRGGMLVDENDAIYKRIGATEFLDATGAVFRFMLSGAMARALLVRQPQSRTWSEYAHMKPPQLDDRSLLDFVGAYTNPGLATTWCIALSGSHLILERKRFSGQPAIPIWRDAFVMGGIEALFERRQGRVSGFSVLADRLSGLRFTRTPATSCPL